MTQSALRGYMGRVGRGALSGALLSALLGLALMVSETYLIAQTPTIAASSQSDASVDASADASADRVFARRITIRLTQMPLKQAIDSAARIANVFVQYRLSMLQSESKVVTVNVTNAPFGVVLERMLDGTSLRVVPGASGSLTIVKATGSRPDSVPADGTIIGRVVDSVTGRGLTGVTVKIAGLKLSPITQDSGIFAIRNVPTGSRLVTVRVFGYRPAEQSVDVVTGQTATIRVRLASVPNTLTGVVTTATGVQRKVEIGNDITVLNADSIVKVAPVLNLTDMLATRVPGLMVQRTSGVPGAPSRIRIRGASSITTSDDPIVVVDGIRIYADQSGNTTNTATRGSGGGSSVLAASVGGTPTVTYAGPSPLDQIDPNSIETIEVLKGPSATATYGSDAANGVIVITTKHGRAGPTRWSVSANQGWTSLPGDWPTFYHAFFRPAGGGPAQEESIFDPDFRPGDVLVARIPYQALNDSRVSPLGTGTNRQASLIVSGGSGGLNYSVTGTGTKQIGYLHLPSFVANAFQATHGFSAPAWMTNPTTYTTYGETGQLTAQLGRSGASVSLMNSIFRSAQQQSSLEGSVGTLQLAYVDTSLLEEPWTAQALASQLFPNYYTRVQLNTTTFTNAVSLNNWTPWSWLPPFNATAGLNVVNQANNALTPRDYALGGVGSATDTLGSYQEGRGTIETRTLSAGTLLMRRRLVSTAVGLNVVANSQDQFAASTIGLPIGVSVPTTLLYTNGGPTQSSVHTATYGWYVQPMLNWNSRLYVNPGFRFDGGSASGQSNQLNLFPKIDVSYVALDNSDTHSALGLTLLRPRVALGVAGVQPGPGEQLRLFQPNEVLPADGSTPIGIANLQSLGNTQLVPERSREFEGGVDANFGANQRVTVTLTAYRKMRYNAIVSVPVAPSVSVPLVGSSGDNQLSFYENVGTIRNTGVEASVATRLLDSRMVGWSVNANITHDRNIVTKVSGALPVINLPNTLTGYDNRIIAGYPLDGGWTHPLMSYADVNGDGILEANEVVQGDSLAYVGSPQPNYELSVSTTLSLFNNRVQLNTAVDYVNGLTQLFNNGQGLSLAVNDPSSTLAQQAALVLAGGTAQTVSALRWNTLSLSYIAPPSISQWFRVPALSFALQGSNLALHTNYHGKDPNVNAFSTGNLTADAGQLPQPRTWSLRVSLGN